MRTWVLTRVLVPAVALFVFAPASAAEAASLTLGTSNTSNAPTTLTGNTPGGPELKVVNTNASQPAVRGEATGAGAGAFGLLGVLTTVSPGTASAAVRGQNNATNGQGYGVWGSQGGAGAGVYGTAVTGTGIYGRHLGSGGTGAGVRGDSASTAAGAFSVYGLLSPASPGTGSAAVRGESKATNYNGYGVWGSQAGPGVGVYGTSNGFGAVGRSGSGSGLDQSSAGVWGDSSGAIGVIGTSSDNRGLYGQSVHNVGIEGYSTETHGILGRTVAAHAAGVYGLNSAFNGIGTYGYSSDGTGVRGDSLNFQGVSGSSVHNAGVYGETIGDGFAAYFNGRTEQHGNLNTYGGRVNVADGQVRVVHGGTALSDTSAALNAEQEGSSGEAGWLRVADPSNTNAVLMLIKQASGSGDFLKCYNQSGPGSYAQKCHVDANGTFVSGSDFAEALPARGAYGPGDVLCASTSHPGHVVRSTHARDRALIGVYSTRPAVLGADKGGITRVGKNDVPVAITGIVPVKATAQNGPIRPGDLLTSSPLPGRAMNAGRNPAIGTVLGKALGVLEHGNGTVKMLVMLR